MTTRVDPARTVAFDALRAVSERGAYANIAMSDVSKSARLSSRDAGFATELVYGTIRQRALIDAVLAECVDRPLADLDASVVDVLRLGVHQLLYLRTPSHAAVSETVELATQRIGPGPAKLVNAVLRRVARHDLDTWVDRVAPSPDDPVAHLAVARSHPRWIVEALDEALTSVGRGGPAQLEDLLIADNTAPHVSLAARPGRVEVDELLAERGTSPGRWSPYAVTLAGRAPGSIPAVREGRASVQDEGSQLVTLAFTRAPVEGRDLRWLDMCAGPGGKAALLASILGQRTTGDRAQDSLRQSGYLLATDRTAHRARLVVRVLDGLPAGIAVADARTGPWEPGSFDRVLVDAPCTGLGSLRRRPDARWRRTRDDLATLVRLQAELLTAAIDSVRVGGVVGYITCSPVVAETTVIVDGVSSVRAVERLDATEYLPEVPGLDAGPDLRLWPHLHDTDGMYLALLRRIA